MRGFKKRIDNLKYLFVKKLNESRVFKKTENVVALLTCFIFPGDGTSEGRND